MKLLCFLVCSISNKHYLTYDAQFLLHRNVLEIGKYVQSDYIGKIRGGKYLKVHSKRKYNTIPVRSTMKLISSEFIIRELEALWSSISSEHPRTPAQVAEPQAEFQVQSFAVMKHP